MNFNVGEQNNLIIRAFETGTNVFNYIQLAQRINIVRVDGAGRARLASVGLEQLTGDDAVV